LKKRMLVDKYQNFADLQQHEFEYAIHFRYGNSGIAIIAPHGGGIEPGTFEIANSIAGDEHSFYGFEGLKLHRNKDLHVTSTRFDDHQCLDIVCASRIVIAIHGCDGDQENVYIGGLDENLKEHISKCLRSVGFDTKIHPNINLQGLCPTNICNRGMTQRGVQLELEEGLRRKMFAGLKREQRAITTDTFTTFVGALRPALVPEVRGWESEAPCFPNA
jgi:phage replication-related protein YjqB (UPF0714/DUF867 family)